jgi:phosphatidylglycerophosphatase A
MTRSAWRWKLLTTFGLGHRRPASGTWGSIPPILVVALLLALGLGPADAPWVYYPVLGLIILIFAGACVVWGDDAEARWGYDPSEVVADETAGQAVCLLGFPLAGADDPRVAIFLLLTAFLGFRLFDIAKVQPAGSLQKVPSGWGVVLDDLAAGLYAAIVLVVAGAVVG